MQVMIGTTQAEVSEDGREVRQPPPATATDALALPFLQAGAGHATKPTIDLTTLTTPGSAAPSTPMIAFDGRLGASLIVCLAIVCIAARQFLKKDRSRTVSQARLDARVDGAPFLKRCGGRVR